MNIYEVEFLQHQKYRNKFHEKFKGILNLDMTKHGNYVECRTTRVFNCFYRRVK
jgi:hypothetical protein